MNEQEKQQFLQTWEKNRKRGIILYVIATALSWGTLTVIFFQAFLLIFEGNFNLEALKSAYLSDSFIRDWGIFLIGGLCYALTIWFFFNWRYRKLKAAERRESSDDGSERW